MVGFAAAAAISVYRLLLSLFAAADRLEVSGSICVVD